MGNLNLEIWDVLSLSGQQRTLRRGSSGRGCSATERRLQVRQKVGV